ncbi:MAG: response regulator [Anaerolineae bacterium]|nr:response regulator [Anaerolineae bacterium]
MSQSLPEAFIDDVKQVLENLYDFPLLNRHTLAQTTRAGQPNEPLGHRLRREVMEAVESLKPGAENGGHPNAARLYNLLHMHYVGGMTLQEVANELGISVRQAYRDLRHGHESVGEILWFNRQLQTERLPVAKPEVEVIEPVDEKFSAHNAATLLDNAIKAVQRLAEQKSLRLIGSAPTAPILISTNGTVAQQVFIHVLSQAIQQAQPGELHLSLQPLPPDHVTLELLFAPRDLQAGTLPIADAVQSFIQRLRFQIQEGSLDDAQRVFRLILPAQQPTLLVVDDNQGLTDLLQRYFTDSSYKVLVADSGAAGLKLAEELRPDAMIVDLMMPDMDGWELLQRLRNNHRTASIPVIICSVINDPELAYSLGASLFISKPITKDRILDALRDIGL